MFEIRENGLALRFPKLDTAELYLFQLRVIALDNPKYSYILDVKKYLTTLQGEYEVFIPDEKLTGVDTLYEIEVTINDKTEQVHILDVRNSTLKALEYAEKIELHVNADNLLNIVSYNKDDNTMDEVQKVLVFIVKLYGAKTAVELNDINKAFKLLTALKNITL